MDSKVRQRRFLLQSLVAILALLGAFQNCGSANSVGFDSATASLSPGATCAALTAPGSQFVFTQRENGYQMEVDLTAHTLRFRSDGMTPEWPACDTTQALSPELESTIKEAIAALKYTEIEDDRLVAQYLHGSTLQIANLKIWLERGDVSGRFLAPCSSSETLEQTFKDSASELLARSCH